MESIRRRSHAARGRGRLRAVAACAALAVGAVGAGTGIGAKLYDDVRVRLSGGSVAMTMHSALMVRRPTAADLRSAIAHATFPVVFPVGLPAGSRVYGLEATPDGRPSAIFVSFLDAGGRDGPSFVLLDPAVVETDGGFLKASASLGEVYQWRVGGEIVLLAKRAVSPPEVSRIKQAMLTTSPRASLASIEPMLAQVTVLGGNVRLAIAERLRAASGPSVLLSDREIASVPGLAKRGAPILDMRTFHLTKIPYANGQIDYRNVKGSRPKLVAVSAEGVRAMDAVLRSGAERRAGAACGCELLFSQSSATTYRIVEIPMSGSAVRKYSVDARTLAVTPSP